MRRRGDPRPRAGESAAGFLNRTAPAPNQDPNAPLLPSRYFEVGRMFGRQPAPQQSERPAWARGPEPPRATYVPRRTGRRTAEWNAPQNVSRAVGEGLVDEHNRPTMRIQDIPLGRDLVEPRSGMSERLQRQWRPVQEPDGRPRAVGYTADSRGRPTGVQLGLIVHGQDFRRSNREFADDVAGFTGAPADLLYNMAQHESRWIPGREAEDSFQRDPSGRWVKGAYGLTQFMRRTWNDYMDAHGVRYGLPSTMSAQEREELAADPRWNLAMASELARDSAAQIEGAMGRPATQLDIYVYHFSGAAVGERALRTAAADPGANPRLVWGSDQIAKNPGVFYIDGDFNRPRNVGQVLEYFSQSFPNTPVVFGPRGDGSTELGAPPPQRPRPSGNGIFIR